jgi:galactose mutarotase-like enzyme
MSPYRVEPDEQRGLDRLIDDNASSWALINRFGCELIGYRITDPASGAEIPLMYRDAEPEPPEDGWKNHATILFPIVGGLKNKQSKLEGKVVSTRGNHGFARHSTFELVHTETRDQALARYRLLPNEEIRGFYPFDFSLELEFSLKGNVLSVTFTITNPSDNEPIHYCFGWHPGFAAPLFPGKGKKADCRLVLPDGTIRKYHNNEHCRLTGQTSLVETGGPLFWTEEKLEATMMYEINDPALRKVTLEDPASGVNIRVDFPDFPHLGFWSEPGWDFICIEPWQGMDDHEEQEPFDRKIGVVRLEPGATDRRTIRVTPSIG